MPQLCAWPTSSKKAHMRRVILPSLLLVLLLPWPGVLAADVSQRKAQLRQQIEDVGRLLRTLMVSSDYSGEFKPYVDACQNEILELGSSKYQESGATSEGELTVIITILRDGSVRGVRIRQSSGNAMLDALFADTVREAAPFAPFPAALAKDYDRLSLTLRMRYRAD